MLIDGQHKLSSFSSLHSLAIHVRISMAILICDNDSIFGYVAGSIGDAKTFLTHITACAELS